MTASSRSRSRLRRRVVPLGVAGAVVLAGMAVHAASASPSTGALIAEVYGGGGNSGAVYTDDFVELANAGASPLDLGGYSVQYLRGTPAPTSTWRATPLTGTLAGGGRYLVQEWGNTGGSAPLPTPDATGTINLSATDGTVALVSGTAPLTCFTAAACAADPRVQDLVGYGTAVVHEGAGPATGAGNSASVARGSSLDDTDDNATDFVVGPPTPRTSTSGTGGDDGGTVGVTSGADDGGTVGVTSGGDDGGSVGTTGGGTVSGVTGGADDGGTVGVTTGGDDGGTVGVTSGGDDGGTVGVTTGGDDGGSVGTTDGGTVSGVTSGGDDGGTVGVTTGGDDGGSVGTTGGGTVSGVTEGADDGGTVGVTTGGDGGGTAGVTEGTDDGGTVGPTSGGYDAGASG